jgi:hypothetical protein
VWSSEFTTEAATLQGDSEEIAPTPNVKLWNLVVVVVRNTLFEHNPLFESI